MELLFLLSIILRSPN